MLTKLDDGGRAVIPIDLRKRFGLCAGNGVEIFFDGDSIFLTPAPSGPPRIAGRDIQTQNKPE